jgi:hypothetical protein
LIEEYEARISDAPMMVTDDTGLGGAIHAIKDKFDTGNCWRRKLPYGLTLRGRCKDPIEQRG